MARTTILLLESDDLTVAHITPILEHAGFEVIQAYTFEEAFKNLKSMARTLALVILDFELATDDINILERLRNLDFERPLPVLLMGHVPLSEEEIAQLAKDSGYAGYLYKTMPAEKVLEKVSFLALGPEDDRRTSPRVVYETRVYCRLGNRDFIGKTYTLSKGGAFIRLSQEIPAQGTKGRVTFSGSTQEKKSIQLDVEVMFCRKNQSQVISIYPSGIGVRFLNVTPKVGLLLEELVQEQIQKGKQLSEIKG